MFKSFIILLARRLEVSELETSRIFNLLFKKIVYCYLQFRLKSVTSRFVHYTISTISELNNIYVDLYNNSQQYINTHIQGPMHQIQADWLIVLGLFIFQIGFQIGRIYQRKTSSSRWQYTPSQNNCFDTQETMLSVGDQQQQNQTQLKLQWIEQQQQRRQTEKNSFVQQSRFDIVSVNKNNIFDELEPNEKNQIMAVQSQVLSNSRKVELFQPMNENVIHQILQTHLNLPLIQHKYIDIIDKTVSQQYSRIFCQTGRFKKLFFNHQMIGAGGFGQVFSAKSRIEDKNFAIKKLFISNYKNKIDLMKEVKIISSFYHENIVRFFTCWIEEADFTEELSQYQQWLKAQDNEKSKHQSSEKLQVVSHISSSNSDIQFIRSHSQQSLSEKSRKPLSDKKNQLAIVARPQNSNKPLLTLFIQMELCDGGNLYNYLKNRTEICPKFAFKIFQQLLKGVNYLHQLGVVHRDLKPANILIDDKKNQIKIGDFGLAVFFNTQQQSTGYLSEEKQNKFRKVGTPCYIAPELLHGLPLRDLRQADIYSLGVIYYEMLNDFTTHHERGQKLNKLKENQVIGLQNMKLERKLIKLLTKRNRPLVNDIIMKKQFTELKKKYQNEEL